MLTRSKKRGGEVESSTGEDEVLVCASQVQTSAYSESQNMTELSTTSMTHKLSTTDLNNNDNGSVNVASLSLQGIDLDGPLAKQIAQAWAWAWGELVLLTYSLSLIHI